MDPVEREKLFQRWWKASKYCQVIYPEPHLEQYARDGFAAGLSAALTPDTHNHREEGEFGEGATVRRSPVVTDAMLLDAMLGWASKSGYSQIEKLRAALEAALEYKP